MAAPLPGLPGAERDMSGPTFFGVRHLSPAAAYHLRKALDRVRPELVLVDRKSVV